MVRKPIVVVTSHFIESVEMRIDREYEARRSKNGAPFKFDELLAAAEGADAMLVTLTDRIDSEFCKRVSASVRVIATYSVGYDHIDLRAAAERKIAIAYTPGVETDAVADLAMLLLLGASRRAYERKNSYAPERGSRPALPRYSDGSPPAKFSASSVWDTSAKRLPAVRVALE